MNLKFGCNTFQVCNFMNMSSYKVDLILVKIQNFLNCVALKLHCYTYLSNHTFEHCDASCHEMLNVLNTMLMCFYHFCFSTEREEVESASLSTKEKCFDRLVKGNQRGGGVAEDLETPTPSPTTTTSSFSSASVRCLRQRASGTQRYWNQNLPTQAGLWHSDFCLTHFALNFFLSLCIN